MTEEKLNVVEVEEPKKCNCPICTFLRSDELKKFLAVILASFIGCSLAILVFAPKKHFPNPKRPHPPYMRMIDRPLPPPGEFRDFDRQGGPEFRRDIPRHHEFRGEAPRHHEFRGPHHKMFRGEHKKFDWKCKKDFKRSDKMAKPMPTSQPVKAE